MKEDDLMLRNWLLAATLGLALLVISAGLLDWPLVINFGLTVLMFGAAFWMGHVERRGARRR